ncbi:MAG: DUF1802 family protein [Myxococcota bacterium]|nr:DUF1802 family protein [Myxococcota bacterium]
MLEPEINKGLREWSVACEAIRQGQQVFLLRKGGLNQPNKPENVVPEQPFAFVPNYQFQNQMAIKPEACRLYRPQLQASEDDTKVEITTVGVITESMSIENPVQAHRLWERHVWTADYLTERINTRPELKLHLMYVRAYALPEPITIERPEPLNKLVSWIDLPCTINTQNAKPVLQDPQYRLARRLVRELMEA